MIELKDYGAEPAVLDIEAYNLGNGKISERHCGREPIFR